MSFPHPARSRCGRFVLAPLLALACLLAGPSRGDVFDGVDLGSFDPGNLVDLQEVPLPLEDIGSLLFDLPLEALGLESVALFLIDPDGDPETDDSFVLPLRLDDLLEDSGSGSLLASIGLGDEVFLLDDLELIDGLVDLLDNLLGGLLGGILGGGPDDLSLADLIEDLDGAIVEAVGIDLGIPDTTGYVLHSVLDETGLLSWILESEPDGGDGGDGGDDGGDGGDDGGDGGDDGGDGGDGGDGDGGDGGDGDGGDGISHFWQPDIAIGATASRARHRGNNVYSSGAGQTLVRRVNPKKRLRTYVSFQNDGNTNDTCTVSTRRLRSPHLTRRSIWKGANVTARMQTGRLGLPIAPQAYEVIAIHEIPNRKKKRVPARSIYSVTLRSTSDPAKFDSAESLTRTLKKRRL